MAAINQPTRRSGFSPRDFIDPNAGQGGILAGLNQGIQSGLAIKESNQRQQKLDLKRKEFEAEQKNLDEINSLLGNKNLTNEEKTDKLLLGTTSEARKLGAVRKRLQTSNENLEVNKGKAEETKRHHNVTEEFNSGKFKNDLQIAAYSSLPVKAKRAEIVNNDQLANKLNVTNETRVLLKKQMDAELNNALRSQRMSKAHLPDDRQQEAIITTMNGTVTTPVGEGSDVKNVNIYSKDNMNKDDRVQVVRDTGSLTNAIIAENSSKGVKKDPAGTQQAILEYMKGAVKPQDPLFSMFSIDVHGTTAKFAIDQVEYDRRAELLRSTPQELGALNAQGRLSNSEMDQVNKIIGDFN